MKKALFFTVIVFSLHVGLSQNISFDPVIPTTPFQDGDLGSISLGDIDNDGDNDLIITGKGGPIKSTLYRNDGNGNFSEIIENAIEDVYSSKAEFIDVDNDNDLDLFITGSNSSPVYSANLYLNDSTGNFTLVTGTPFEPSASGDFVFGDVDGNDTPDVLMTGYDAMGNGFTKLYLNDGSGVFTEMANSGFEALKNSSVEFIDIDNDKDLDALIAGADINDNPTTLLYTNDNTGTFSLIPNTLFDNIAGGDIAVGDSDNDGDLDIFICGMNDSNEIISKLYLNDSTGSFSLVMGTPFPGTHLGTASFADFDNDGDGDLLLVGSGPGGLADNSIIANIYENQGGNNFALADSLIGTYFSSSAIGDVDGDDDLDLFIAGTSIGSPVRVTRLYTNSTPITSSIDDIGNLPIVRIYPNPSSGIINIDMQQSLPVAIKIYSITGQLVYSQNNFEANESIQLNQSPGLYTVVIQTKNHTIAQKLILN